jgi:phytoene dehydrogenase-like protein
MYARRDELLDGRAVMAYLSFPSLKDPHAKGHTAEIIAPLSYRSLEAYREEPWRRRGVDYESAKDRITRALLDLVERHRPGFRDFIDYSELNTPDLRALHGSAIGVDLRLSGHAREVSEALARR